jgi:hypothetical protein
MIIPIIEKYIGNTATGSNQLARPALNVARWISPIAGTITRLKVTVSSAVIGGVWKFNVSKNGVYLFTTAAAFAISLGDPDDEKTGLSIAIAKGDVISWDLVQAGSGSLIAPFYFETDIDNGFVAGEKKTITYTTASLADAATENGLISLGNAASIRKVTVTRAARVRIYPTAAFRTSDAARAIGTDPTGEHGVSFDLYAPATN